MADARTNQVFLLIPNLERYQHYKERKPPWVKLYRDFWTDFDMSVQIASTRLLFLFLVCYASEFKDGAIVYHIREISRRSSLDKRTVTQGLEKLISSGFVEMKTRRTLASRKQNALPLVQSTEKEKEKNKETSKEREIVREVFDHWVQARDRDPDRTRLTDGRKRVITARLKDFTADELKRAIDGVGNDPWEGRRDHDDLTVVFRPENFEKFLALADTPRTLSERRDQWLQTLGERGAA